jgi:hypothetical protein
MPDTSLTAEQHVRVWHIKLRMASHDLKVLLAVRHETSGEPPRCAVEVDDEVLGWPCIELCMF